MASEQNSPVLSLLGQQINPKTDSTNVLETFSQSWEIIDCQLGDSFEISQYLYLILAGSVRLLGMERKKQREVSTQLLREGEVFGCDRLFEEVNLAYRATATEPALIARIHGEKINYWLQQFPSLQEKWQKDTKERQMLVFFKTLTELSGVSSYRLQQLLTYLKEEKIRSGTALNQVRGGRFWLVSGRASGLNAGDTWESSNGQGIAQSELWVYHLPQEHLEMLGNLGSENAVKGKNPPIVPSSNRTVYSVPTPTNTPVAPPNNEREIKPEAKIEFAQPKKPGLRLWQNYPFIEQQSSSDCGAACLTMISQYWGKRISINWVRELAGVGRSGASLKKLAKAAETIGYRSRPVRASLNSIAQQTNPWIAHWHGDHYIVVYYVKGDKVLVADPAEGKRELSRQEFSEGWTGYAMLLEPTEQLDSAPSEKKSLGRFITLLKPYRNTGLQIILISFLIQVFGVVTPMFTQIILDKVVVNKSFSTLNVFSLGALMFGVWQIALGGIREYLLGYLANRLDLTMISGFIRHALMLPLKFFESRNVGDIITRVQENEKIQRFLISQVMLAWLDFVMGFVYLVVMLYYNWQLTLVVLSIVPPIMILTLVATPMLRQVSREVFNRAAQENSSLVETITGVTTIKATASEKELRWRWEEHLTNFLNAQFQGQKLAIKLQSLNALINSIGGTALTWYGAGLVIQGQLTIGQFFAFNMLIGKVLAPILALANLWDELQEIVISIERLNDVFSAAPEEDPANPMLILPKIRGEIRFENVCFRYEADDDRNVLQNLSFQARSGEMIALVGRSGSGKSTLIKLLEGLYYPTTGKIWIDDCDLIHISPTSLRSQMGVVPQDCYLFSGTILENITLYRPEYTLDQVIEAAKMAEAHAFIQAMPLGYNTKVGERGANFSGGQRQRISIARALLGDPRILILDEATSALDTESERRFQENLNRLARERTSFVIAHRLSTVRNADRIIVLDRGFIVQQGSHDQLMGDRQGLYYHLAQQQLSL